MAEKCKSCDGKGHHEWFDEFYGPPRSCTCPECQGTGVGPVCWHCKDTGFARGSSDSTKYPCMVCEIRRLRASLAAMTVVGVEMAGLLNEYYCTDCEYCECPSCSAIRAVVAKFKEIKC